MTTSLPGIVRGRGYDSATFDYVYVEAIKQKLLGNSGDALKYFEQCIRINPSSDAVYYQMAQILLSAGDLKNGKAYLKKAVEMDPANIWYIKMVAGAFYQERNIDSAIFWYEQAVKRYPDREELMYTLGNLYSENKKYRKAGELFSLLDNKYGINERSTPANIRNMINASDYDEAMILITKMLEEFPDEILYNGFLAEIYRKKGENIKAIEVYTKLMDRNPENPDTQLALCDFLIAQENYDELLQLINTVTLNENISRESKIELFAEIIENKKLVDEKGHEISVAIMVLEATYPNDGIIVLLRPELYGKMGELKDAVKRLEEITGKMTDNYFAWEKLLLLYLQTGDYKNLEKKGEEGALRFNRSFLAKMLYAAGAAENKNFDVALEEVRKAEILAGDNEDMLLQVISTRADIYYRMKDFEKAFGIFQDAINNYKSDLTILNNYAYYLAEQNMKLREAEKMAKRVIDEESDNYTFLDTYAWVLYKRGKLREAEKIMQKILENSEKRDAEFYEHMGYIKKKRKKCDEAIENWNIAFEIDNKKVELLKEIEKCRGIK
ncbi:MAG TPA: hypothetical protein DDW27_17065 [Bacteroidales bacterium]|nr:hypothetical protein [Bacteroidales bacterium]